MQVSRELNAPTLTDAMPAEAHDCRCHGTGAYAAEIALADAVVLVQRICLDHLALRTRLRDTATGNVGEVMEINKQYKRVHLRPVGGGREWTAYIGTLELPERSA